MSNFEDAESRLKQGRFLFAKRDYEEVIKILNHQSLAFNAEALTLVSEAMSKIPTKTSNHQQILMMRICAANLGSMLACIRVAEEYYLDQSKHNEAKEYFIKAKSLGSNLARSRLADYYLNTGSNYGRALNYKIAAEHGNATGMFGYAKSIELGFIEPDYCRNNSNFIKEYLAKKNAQLENSSEWYIKAASAGSVEVIGKIMNTPLITGGKEVMRKLQITVQDIEKGCNHGEPFAMAVKGYWYLNGSKFPGASKTGDSTERALDLLKKSAKLGNTYAMGTLGLIHDEDRLVPRDAAKALAWTLMSLKSDENYSPPIERFGYLICDIESEIPLELCESIKANPEYFI